QMNFELREIGNQINSLAQRIAQLNEQIYEAKARKQNPNDLLDQRDKLVQELSRLTGATVEVESNGSATVYIGRDVLVHRNTVREVYWKQNAERGKGGGDLTWRDNDQALQIDGGVAYGKLVVRDDAVPEALSDLDELADTLRDRVNELHLQGIGRDGSTGTLFWRADTSGAVGIEVNPDLLISPERLAASTVSATGDNALAHQMFELQFEEEFNGGKTAFNDFYHGIVTRIGNRVQEASAREEAASAGLEQAKTWQQHISGVNLDEEMANMVQLQHAYTAAARVTSAVDELITTLLQMV
ncbi:MAG TPA: flagellar hook-associated protein FlgK, partial [Bacteroidetes bacterium]|nr:flagellar hook-associated protein FlgK [Bacteroidota bacterium]